MYLYSTRPETIRPIVITLAGALCVIVPCDVLRLHNESFEQLYEKVVGFLMRESEKVCFHISIPLLPLTPLSS